MPDEAFFAIYWTLLAAAPGVMAWVLRRALVWLVLARQRLAIWALLTLWSCYYVAIGAGVAGAWP